MEVSGQLPPWPLSLLGKSPWSPLDRRLGGPQSRSGRYGVEKNLSFSVTEPRPTLKFISEKQCVYVKEAEMFYGKFLFYGFCEHENEHSGCVMPLTESAFK
jgi:hypothetical protein